LICPSCPGNVEMLYIDEHWQCGICNGQWWPPEKPERGPYEKIKTLAPISSPECLIWGTQNIDYKQPLPPGEPTFGGGSKSGKKRKKPPKKDIRIVYET
jgi:hypothetical protein